MFLSSQMDTSGSRWLRHVEFGLDFLVTGHTHIQHTIQLGGTETMCPCELRIWVVGGTFRVARVSIAPRRLALRHLRRWQSHQIKREGFCFRK